MQNNRGQTTVLRDGIFLCCQNRGLSPDSQAKSEFPEYLWAGLGWRFFQERLFCFVLYLLGIQPILSLPSISRLLERSFTTILSRHKLHDSTSF
jgi:hypothetical protein